MERKRERERGLLLGLTGGIGAGKTTAARILEEHGAALVEADQVAREVLRPGTPEFDRLASVFGRGILDEDKRLDRKKLAALVFFDADKLAELNEVAHRPINEQIKKIAIAKAAVEEVVVIDHPLLFETAMDAYVDHAIVVTAPVAVRLERLVELGYTLDEAKARMAAQMTDEERIAKAEFVVVNDGTPERLREELAKLAPLTFLRKT